MASRDLSVQRGTKFHPLVDDRLEGVSRKFGLGKSEIIRRCVSEALPKFERARRLPAFIADDGDGEESE